MEINVKEIAKELAPTIETIVKENNEASQKEFKETLESLQKDIAEVKTLSKWVKLELIIMRQCFFQLLSKNLSYDLWTRSRCII